MENSLNKKYVLESNKQQGAVGDRTATTSDPLHVRADTRTEGAAARGGGIKYYRTEIANQNQNLIYMQYLNLSYKDHLNKCLSGFGL